MKKKAKELVSNRKKRELAPLIETQEKNPSLEVFMESDKFKSLDLKRKEMVLAAE